MNTMTTACDTATKDEAKADEVGALRDEVAELKHQLAWYKKQLFGSKSEKRIEENPDQLQLFGSKQTPVSTETENHLRTR